MPGRARIRPLSTLVVSGYGTLGGAEQWLLGLLAATSRLDVEAVVLGSGPLDASLSQDGIATTVHPTGRGRVEQARATAALLRRLRRRRPEVILANGVKAAVVAAPAARLAAVPIVWARHDYSFDPWLTIPLARAVDAVVGPSREVLAPIRRAGAVIPPPLAPTPPKGRPEARAFWRERGLPLDDGPTAAMVARLVRYKGIEDAIAALARPDASAWRLVVIGDDDPASPGERARLERVALRLGVADRVRFEGRVEDAGRWLAAFDAACVLTTRDEDGFGREGFAVVALEAMRAGVPVIAVEGTPVVARGREAGALLVPAGSPRAVASRLSSLRDAELWSRLSAAGRREADRYPEASRSAARLASILAEVAGRPAAGLRDGASTSVVTTVLNEGRELDRLLGALVPQLRDDDELVVVDGGSRDDTQRRAREWSRRDRRVRLIVEPGASIPRGRNVGIEAARHDVIACTDVGCQPVAGWLDALRLSFGNDPSPDLVTGVYRVAAAGSFEHAMAASAYPDVDEARRPSMLSRIYGRWLGRTFDPTMPTGRSMAVRRDAWSSVGGFPEALDFAEDVTFGRAIAATGRRCVLDLDAEVAWVQRPTLAGTVVMYHRYGLGDGRSRDPKIVVRDLARAVAYLVGPTVLVRAGWRGRLSVTLAAAAYLSLPLRRAARRPRPLTVVALVPLALAVKDVAKAIGCVRGVLAARSG